jgi:hypothetical protein
LFSRSISRQLKADQTVKKGTAEQRAATPNGVTGMSGRWVRNLIILLYLIIGGFIAWDHGYLGLAWLRTLASAILAILLWWLVLLGVNLHIHG